MSDRIETAMIRHTKTLFGALLRRVASNRVGLLVAMGAALFVCGWRSVVVFNRPAHLQDMAAELGSVAEFWGEPSADHGGTKILFQQSTETGVGMFLGDMATGRQKLLCEQAEKGFDWRNFQALGWAPDDSCFAYSRRPDKESSREIVISAGNSGADAGVVEIPRTVTGFAWLSSNAPRRWSTPTSSACGIVRRRVPQVSRRFA